MSTTPRDPIDELAVVVARTGKHARRVLAGPDGPLAAALLLGLLAMVEVTLYAADMGSAMIPNLIATLPLALARRHLVGATAAIVFGVLLSIAVDRSTLTIAALLALVIVVYLFALTYGRRGPCFRCCPSSPTRSCRSPETTRGCPESCC